MPIFVTDKRVLDLLHQVLASQQRMEKKMGDISADIDNLVSAVQAVTTDVTAVLDKLKNAPNLNAAQQKSLEDQIAALQTLDQTLKDAASTP